VGTKETADPSTSLRFGRDDKVKGGAFIGLVGLGWGDLLFHSATKQSSLEAPPFTLSSPQHCGTKIEVSSRPKRSRISCHVTLDNAAYAHFRKEGRTKFDSATKFHWKSGVA
jgi:hypothetical protein